MRENKTDDALVKEYKDRDTLDGKYCINENETEDVLLNRLENTN